MVVFHLLVEIRYDVFFFVADVIQDFGVSLVSVRWHDPGECRFFVVGRKPSAHLIETFHPPFHEFR